MSYEEQRKDFIRFGTYAIFIHYWEPDKDWLRNSLIGNTIKLLAASLEHEYYPTESGTNYDADDFQQLIGVV